MSEQKTEVKRINLDDASTVQPIYLQCILMGNNEVIFHGRSLGFLKNDEIQNFVFVGE